ncbi:thiamine-phosphate kinase [Thermoflavimicrobium dichotomicum]|uniref:Thiamine-monophosphate kinase n=1 Tax=Thermoflavimicrobium dichotomicum TaxID=46223 RepID=A0A1I3TR83_9BACL|nr:thiamine-phosphate kinase [Thermoflavimicrobium dichotomicum]SFJ73102.1 thiamine-monophosphate kinase [Thermoflavimicrobium dichotomicum]
MNDEFSFIRSLIAHRFVESERIEVDVGDDAAVVIPHSDRSLVMTCDTMVETVHFLRKTMSPADIGWKLLASNLSDLAAMGAVPTYALISVAVPPSWQAEEVEEIYHGIYDLAREWKVSLMGGDTVRIPEYLTLTLTLLGEVGRGEALLRSSAKPGDVVFVTGTVGDAAAGLHLLLHHPDQRFNYPALVQAHCRPNPQLHIGKWLVSTRFRPACDDISDGLAQEAWEIAEASQVCIVLDREKIPISEQLLQYAKAVGQDPFEWVWFGGEDYQLIGTVRKEYWAKLKETVKEKGFLLSMIGRVESGTPQVEVESEGIRMVLPKRGYNHFADR